MKIMVAYDGTLQAQEALKYGISKAKEKGAELVVQHVFNADMFSDYDATPNAREAARDESARFVAEAESIIREKAKGVKLVSCKFRRERPCVPYAESCSSG